ncbi:MAG: SUMF1/EgtB/PvdO family nonheme iron enzyme [bacterium]|nr:SUMF1/EgtB/PvdO family nonheme iron enzyme [bacterium]
MTDEPQDRPENFSPEAVDAFTAYVERVQEGETPDVEELCAQHPDLAGELRPLYASWRALTGVFERLSEPGEGSGTRVDPSATATPELLETFFARLEASKPEESRYHIRGQVSEGGQGAVMRVWDEHLRRPLAMKVMIGAGAVPATGATPPLEQRRLGRFLEEAQVTSQLDHPSIVPVHELGLDADGRLYYTMKLVRGRDLGEVIERVHAGVDEDWTVQRALGVVLKVCDAIAFAHAKGVVHRDLKPDNVMVGRYGEVYVIDWGMARVMGHEDRRNIGLTTGTPSDDVSSERSAGKSKSSADSGLFTQDGDVVGTVHYMPPEQAEGRTVVVGPRSDVYAAGAVLYHVIGGKKPYHDVSPANQEAVRSRVVEGPPAALRRLAPKVPEELLAICEKAMHRDPRERYADMREMAADLRAYLENRVVQAHRTGAWVETKKWIARNKRVAGLAFALATIVPVSLVSYVTQQRRAHESAQLLQTWSDTGTTRSLLAEAETIRLDDPSCVARFDDWLAAAEALRQRAPRHRAELDAIRANGTRNAAADGNLAASIRARLDEDRGALAGLSGARAANDANDARAQTILDLEIADAKGRVASGERELEIRANWDFDDAALAPRHASLVELNHGLVQLYDERAGVVRRMAARRAQAAGATPSGAWRTALPDIAAAYPGLELTSQYGLEPLGRNPGTGLWEFWHVFSGDSPLRNVANEWEIDGSTGIVLVLIPGGTFAMGAAPGVPGLERHDVTLAPYFLSKYEMTQGQWIRATGHNPSTFAAGMDYINDPRIGRDSPIETVSWEEAHAVLELWDLTLPTEAQWERAARGGRTTTYWWGDDVADGFTPPKENIFDQTVSPDQLFDDGWRNPAPVDSLFPGPFGLHNALGNVQEWCLDSYAFSMAAATHRPGSGELIPTAASTMRAVRGGCFKDYPTYLEPGRRQSRHPGARDSSIGVRPARRIDP